MTSKIVYINVLYNLLASIFLYYLPFLVSECSGYYKPDFMQSDPQRHNVFYTTKDYISDIILVILTKNACGAYRSTFGIPDLHDIFH